MYFDQALLSKEELENDPYSMYLALSIKMLPLGTKCCIPSPMRPPPIILLPMGAARENLNELAALKLATAKKVK